ncbi:hypothetical protein TWF281_006825 [Arthrobotrys megalospora]
MPLQSSVLPASRKQSATENPYACLSTCTPEQPLSKRVKLSEIKQDMGVENLQIIVDSSDSSCSTLSPPEEFDAVPQLVNATEYVREHLQPSVLCNDTELSLDSSRLSHSISKASLDQLATELKLPSWKLDSIKAGGSLLIFGNKDSAPLSELAQGPGSSSRKEIMNPPHQRFHASPTNWKISSADHNRFVFLETIKGVPPEAAVWVDGYHGNQVNPTRWISAMPNQKAVYHYNSRPPVANKFYGIAPNYICADSKKSAASIFVQRKFHKRPGKGASAGTKAEKRARPADGAYDSPHAFSLCNTFLASDHDLDVEESMFEGVTSGRRSEGFHARSGNIQDNEVSNSFARYACYDGTGDEKPHTSPSKSQEITEEDINDLPVFERSARIGIRVIYITRDPNTGDRIPLVDYVQEEDERYRYVRDELARGRENRSIVDSVSIDCPRIKQNDLKARLHLAYDNLEERLNFLIREGKLDPQTYTGQPPDTPNTNNKKPVSLLISLDDDRTGFDGPANGPDSSTPAHQHVPMIHGGKCGSEPPSPRLGPNPRVERFPTPPPKSEGGLFCKDLRVDGDMIQISAEFGYVFVRAGGKKFHYPFNSYPHMRIEEAIGQLCVPEGEQLPLVLVKLLKVQEVYELIVEALYSIWEYGPDNRSETSYLSGSDVDFQPTPVVQSTPVIQSAPVVQSNDDSRPSGRDDKERIYEGEEWTRIVFGDRVPVLKTDSSPKSGREAYLEDLRAFGIPEEWLAPQGSPDEEEEEEGEGEREEEEVEEDEEWGMENPLIKPVFLGDDKPQERKENLYKKLVTPESDVKALSGGGKENPPQQETRVTGELLEVISNMQAELRQLGERHEADSKVMRDQGREMVRMAGRISSLESMVAELAGKLKIRDEEKEELVQKLQQRGPAGGCQDLLGDEDVDLIQFDDPSDLKEVPVAEGSEGHRVAVVTEWEPLAPIPDDTTQLVVVATETGAAAGILERVRRNLKLCRQLVYLEVRGGQLDIRDDEFCQLIKLCPDLVGVALRGAVHLTDASMRSVLTSCRMICGLELSGTPSTPGKITSGPLKGIPHPWQGCSLRELILRHQPEVREEEAQGTIDEEHPCVRLTLANEGHESVLTAGSKSFPPHTYEAMELRRWASLRGELWTDEEFFARSQGGIYDAVREGVARSSVVALLTYKHEFGGLTWMMDDYQMEGGGEGESVVGGEGVFVF